VQAGQHLYLSLTFASGALSKVGSHVNTWEKTRVEQGRLEYKLAKICTLV